MNAAPMNAAPKSAPTRITVRPGAGRPYDVVVGTELLAALPEQLAGALRVAVVYPGALADRAVTVVADLVTAGYLAYPLVVPDGEGAKSLASAERCWEALGGWGFTRSDAVVGLGGGAVTDLAGFLAATWLRGVRVVQIPTTLLAMVDAAIGGKTALNTHAGKNLVGAFHQPSAVLCDLDLLTTLARPDYVAGLAEVIKTGLIADPVIVELVEAAPAVAAEPTGQHTRELIERSIRVKAEVVSADPTELGRREILNYGHTLAHAIEKVEGYTWRHGAAVSVGLVYAAALARVCGRLDDATADRHRAILAAIGLPTTYRGDRWPALHEAMAIDKKNRGAHTRFIVLDGLAKPGVLDDPDPGLLEAAFAEVAE